MRPTTILAAGVGFTVLLVTIACAKDSHQMHVNQSDAPAEYAATQVDLRGARLETLWIFDADFEDLTGDNAGWTAYDVSGTLAQTNYWHKDTIRIPDSLVYLLGDSTWWCGTYNECWRHPRGYGNFWVQILKRSFSHPQNR